MPNVPSSGIEPGQRRLNGPQTTGRDYRNLSQPTHAMEHEDDVAAPGENDGSWISRYRTVVGRAASSALLSANPLIC